MFCFADLLPTQVGMAVSNPAPSYERCLQRNVATFSLFLQVDQESFILSTEDFCIENRKVVSVLLSDMTVCGVSSKNNIAHASAAIMS